MFNAQSRNADLKIVKDKEVVKSARSRSTTLIGEDTDLLVLLLYYAHQSAKEICYHSEKKINDQGA